MRSILCCPPLQKPELGSLEILVSSVDSAAGEAHRLIGEAWAELKRTPYVQRRLGVTAERFPDVSFDEADRRSSVGRALLARLETVDSEALPHELALTLRLVKFRAQVWSKEARWYWIVCDPRGIGQFGLSLPTAYNGGYLLNGAQEVLDNFPLESRGDTERYLTLLTDYARLVEGFRLRTAGQAERGIFMPKAQVSQARALLSGFRTRVRASIQSVADRQLATPATQFAREVDLIVSKEIEPAFDRALEGFGSDYLARAAEQVGLGQYPEGEGIYEELVKLHTTLDLTPDQVHAIGLRRMEEIESAIRDIQQEMGFKDDPAAFVAHLDGDPDWRASTADGVAGVFQRYIDRLQPHLQKVISALPQASYGVEALPEALQGSMTYGYYDPPKDGRPRGIYYFNAANLTRRPLVHLAVLTYHELMPGHHLQFSIQQQNGRDSPFRAQSFVNAYIEGWAEYAAHLAGEMNLYELPEERYGRLIMDAFLTSRLVVDTGMNVMGWTLERARTYMRQHSRLAEAEVLTESVRYSCDTPAQALAYKVGDRQILGLRERTRQALGSDFDLRSFHGAVLSPGALPLSDLEWHIERWIESEKARRNSPRTKNAH